MNKNIDVLKIASDIEVTLRERNKKQIEELAASISSKDLDFAGILSKAIVPLIAKMADENKLFTVELVKQVVEELQKAER